MSAQPEQNDTARPSERPRRYPSVVVVSGGSAGNEILDAFVAHFDKISFILPVSDNGGSSSEIIRLVSSHCWLMSC